MVFKINRKKWTVIVVIALMAALFPIIFTAFELVSTDKNSVVFLEKYPASIRLLFLFYYLLLIFIGIFWFIKQVVTFFKLKNEISKAELHHLKSQVNPHFFFNILNNLYGLVKKDSKKAQQLILKLSDLMRYSIYEGERDVVTLKEEVDYLINYIELHKMRYHKDVDVRFNCQVEEDFKVMPLLFIILIENAFKHGVENLRKNAYVDINIVSFEGKIHFTIENNFDNSENNKEEGIGLKNLKRRLELVYPNKHELSFLVKDNIYKTTLILHQL